MGGDGVVPTFDVVVIGSGPAGCSAAAICRKAGLNVLIITDEPADGGTAFLSASPLESIHPGVSSLLEKIDAAGAETAAASGHYSGIYTNGTYTPLGEDEMGVWEGLHIRRDIFNAQLLLRIQQSGVAVRHGQKVEDFILEKGVVRGIITRPENYTAAYVIDATGKNALAGKKLNFKRKFFSPALVCWTGVSRAGKDFTYNLKASHFIPHPDGWTWLAPQPNGHCAWTRLTGKGEKSFLPPEELKEYDVVGPVQIANMRWRMFRPVCSEGIVLCGDAAGILDPAAGQGIFNALWSGIAAANTVVACLRQPDYSAFHLAQYDNWYVQQFEMKVGQLRKYYLENNIKIAGMT